MHTQLGPDFNATIVYTPIPQYSQERLPRHSFQESTWLGFLVMLTLVLEHWMVPPDSSTIPPVAGVIRKTGIEQWDPE